MPNELAIHVPYTDLERMAAAIAKSRLFGIQTQEQAIALCLLAQAEGLHPATAARDYNIIQGRPALTADAMLARYIAQGGKVEWLEYTDEKVSARFTHPLGGSVVVDWDNARLAQAGIGGKDMHSKYPRQMKRARCISEGIRTVCPGVLSGLYTPEEVNDMPPLPAPQPAQNPQPRAALPASEVIDITADSPQPSVRKLDRPPLPPDTGDVPPPAPPQPVQPPARKPAPTGMQPVYIKATSAKNAQRESKPFMSVKFDTDEGEKWANIFDTNAWPLLVKGATVYGLVHKKGDFWNIDGISETPDGGYAPMGEFAAASGGGWDAFDPDDIGPPLDMDGPLYDAPPPSGGE